MSSAATARAVERTRRGERILELAAVVILAMATLGSAWCAYEATRWNSEETSLAQQATNEQVEASRLFGLATQAVSYDSTLVAQYAEAVADGNDGLKEFYRTTLIRPAFLPVLDRWEAQLASGAEHPRICSRTTSTCPSSSAATRRPRREGRRPPRPARRRGRRPTSTCC